MAENTKYLYGAAVQGIQQFIFQTNELKDIVGASELVEQICTTAFDEFGKPDCGESIIRAAGNIKFIFNKREDCEKTVLNFPKKVMTMAPGITISQAVVRLDNDSQFEKASEDLEEKLKAQRNIPMRPTTLGLIGIRRSRKTGMPAIKEKDGDFLDSATAKKQAAVDVFALFKKFFNKSPKEETFTTDINKLTGKNDWIAVVHIDGNSLGSVVRRIGSNKDQYKAFSQALDKATKDSVHAALQDVDVIKSFSDDKPYPIRPIVLGGDDVTFICKGDVAVPFTKAFMEQFEKKAHFDNDTIKLTSCAGIAFIKSSFPFYYGYDLAEELCEKAKKDAKNEKHIIDGKIPSCLLFHKVQDSFVEDFGKIAKRELSPFEGHSFLFGPYYLDHYKESLSQWTDECRLTIGELMNDCVKINENNTLKSHLRKWMSLMHTDPEDAKQFINRAIAISGEKEFYNKMTTSGMYRIDNDTNEYNRNINYYPVYDLLTLSTINTQQTK